MILSLSEIDAVKKLAALNVPVDIIMEALDLTPEEWADTLQESAALAELFGEQLNAAPVSPDGLHNAPQAPPAYTGPPRTHEEWINNPAGAWGTDPGIGARNIVREFERTHGMEPGTDPNQNLHKGMAPPRRR